MDLCSTTGCHNNDLRQFEKRFVKRGRHESTQISQGIVECLKCKTLYDYEDWRDKAQDLIRLLEPSGTGESFDDVASARTTEANVVDHGLAADMALALSIQQEEIVQPISGPNSGFAKFPRLCGGENMYNYAQGDFERSRENTVADQGTTFDDRDDNLECSAEIQHAPYKARGHNSDYDLALALEREEQEESQQSQIRAQQENNPLSKEMILLNLTKDNSPPQNTNEHICVDTSRNLIGPSMSSKYKAKTLDVTNSTAPDDRNTPMGTSSKETCNRDDMNSIIMSLPCKHCGTDNPDHLKPVLGGERWEPQQKFCHRCDDMTGYDDSFTMEDLIRTIQAALEQNEIKMPCAGCDNDDPFEFTFRERHHGIVIQCNKCSHPHDVGTPVEADARGMNLQALEIEVEAERRLASDDDCEGVPQPAEDTMRCPCGNDDRDLLQVHIHECGLPYLITCFMCKQILILDFDLAQHHMVDAQSHNTIPDTKHDGLNSEYTAPAGDKMGTPAYDGTPFGKSAAQPRHDYVQSLTDAYALYKNMQPLFEAAIGKKKVDNGVKAIRNRATVEANKMWNITKVAAVKHGKWVGPALNVTVEGISTYSDITSKKAERDRGECSHKEYVNFSVKRGVEGAVGAGAAIAGGLVGQSLIPIPIVGSLIGSTVGRVLGKGVAKLVGGLVVDW